MIRLPVRTSGPVGRVAWLSVALHALGLGAALGMRPGTAVVDLPSRMAFLAAAPLRWSAGWGVWMLCALSLVAFFVVAAERLPALAGRAALALVAAGAAVDLFCDAGQAALLPALAGDARLFLAVERLLGVGGAVVANGLYTLATLVVTLSVRSGWPRLFGLLCVAGGAAMVAAGFGGVWRYVELTVGPTMLFYCAWAVATANVLDRP
jgi:hypothetical protein